MSTARLRLLLGKSRWRRRQALPDDWLAGVDPIGRPTFLYLTDTWRKRGVVEREFRDRDCFAPPVRVVGELFHDLWLRHGDGRAILNARSEAVLAERLMDRNPGRWPWLESLGRPRASGEALARLAAMLAEAGVDRLPEGARHRAELDDALSVLETAHTALDDRVTRASAVRRLLKLLERPPPALMQWLRLSHSVIVDDVLQPSPLRTEALIALCRAWSSAGAHVVWSLASGRDLGGREAGQFFEYDEDSGYGLKPFAATRALRLRLFEAWVSSGEAEIYVAGPDSVVRVDPWNEPEPAGPVDLSDMVYSGQGVPVETEEEARQWLAGRVRLVRAPTPADELRWIARSVRDRLDRGAAPEDCVVAWPGAETHASMVRDAFDDFEIPIALGAGEPLEHAPVARALAQLPRLAIDGFPADPLLALADLAAWPLGMAAGEISRWCRAAGVRGGPPRAWFPRIEGLLRRSRRGERLGDLGKALEILDEQTTSLSALTEPATPQDWRDRLLDCAARCGLEAIAGGSDRALIAWGGALAALDALVIDLQAVDPGPWPAEQLADHLGRTLAAARWQPDTEASERVQVVGVLELRGLSPTHTWLGGLVRGRFPSPPTQSPILEPALARRLDPVDALAEARYLFHAALRNALDDPTERTLVLSWSHSDNGRHLAPSPVLADLLGLGTNHPEGRDFGVLVTDETGAPTAPWSRRERTRASLIGVDWSVDEAHRGQLPRPPPIPKALSVTALETLVRCPARYWYDRVLRLESDDPWSPELEPNRRGTAIHRILQRFVEATGLRPLAGEARAPLAYQLHSVALAELDRVDAEGGFEPALQAWARGRWLAGLVDARPAGILARWLDLEIRRSVPWTPVGVEHTFDGLDVGGLALRGQLDRLDRHPSGALLVTDYKTGSAPAAARVLEGLALQPLVYAEAARRMAPDAPVAAAYLTLKRADDVRHRAWTGDPVALDALMESDQRRYAAALPRGERDRILASAAELARTALAGDFRTTQIGASKAGCSTCSYARICRVDHAEQVLDPGEVA